MGIEIPESLQWVAKWIVGAGDWPEGDETAMWRVSDAWSAMSSALNEIDDEAAHAVGQALAAIDGETHEAIAAYWDRLTGQKGAWTSLVKYLDSLADQIGDGAADIEQTKLVIIGTMVIFAIEMAPLLATAWTGISAAGAVALRVATQITIRMAIKQLIARMLTRAAAKAAARAALHGAIFEAIEEGGLEIGTKILQVGIGHRDEITMQDVKDAGVAAAAGAAGGAVGAGLGNGGLLSGAADVASSRLGRATVAATTEATTGIAGEIAGAATAAALTDQPFNLTLDSITSSAAQGVPAGVHAAGNHHSDTDAPTLDPSVEDLGNTPPAPGTLQSEGTQPAGNDTGVPAEPSETQGAPASDSTTPAAADTTSPTNSIDTNQAPAPDHNESTSAASSTAPSENAGTRTDPTTPAISGADTPTASATNGPLSQNLSVTDGVAPDRSDITADNPVGQQDSSPPTPSTGAGPDTAASEISSTADSPQAPTTEHPAATQQPAVATPDSLAGQQVSAQSPQPSAADSLVGQPTQATTSPTDNVAAPATLGTSPDRLESSTTTLPLSDTAASAPNQVESSTNATAPGSTTTASAPTLSPPPASTHAPAADAGQRAAAPTTDAASPTQSANPAQTSNPTQPPATSAPVAAGPAPGSRAVATPLGPTTAGPANPVSDPARSPSTTQAPLSSEAARAPEPARAQANPAPPDSARATTPTTADPTRAPNSPAATPSTQRPPAVEQDAHAHANVDHNWSTDIPPRTGERYDTRWGAEEGIADLLRPDQGQSDRGGVPIQGDEGQPRSEPDHRQDGRHRPDGPTGGRDFPLRRGADADQSQTREDLAAERRDRLVDPRVNVTTPTDTESTSAPLPPHSTTPRAATPDLPSTALAQPRSVPDRSAPDVPHYTEPSVSSLPPGYSHLDPDFHQRQSRLPDWWPREGAPTGTPQPSDTRAQRDSEPGTHPDQPRRSPVVDNFIARAPESLPPSRRPGPETPPSQPPAQAHRPPNPAQNQQDQARAAREFFRNQRPDSDRVTEVNPARHPFSANAPSFDVRRYADRGISVISVRVHLTPGPYASPLEIRNLMESAQAATDQAFNTAPRLLNGDRLLVDLVFTTDPSTAHLRATVTQAPGDLSNWSVHARPETLANNIRQQLGLLSNEPGTHPGLTAADLRQISNDIAAAHTPSSFTDLPGTRVIDHHRLRDLEDDAYQAAVEDSLRDGDRFTQGADPRTHPYGQLINDGGPTRPGRGNNCLDNALAALSSFFGRPQVALPRWLDQLPNGTLDLRSGERGGVERAANWLGSGLTGYNNRGLTVSEQFDSVHNWIAHLGPGSAALVVNEWAARDRNGELRYDRNGDPLTAGSHATVIVYPPSAAGPLWWCPQSGAISDHPPAWMVDDSSGVWFTPIPPDRGVRNAGAVSNQRPSGAIPGTDLRPRSGAPTLPVRERLGGASDLDRRGDSGGTRTRADETGDRFRDRISNRVPELVGQDGDGQLHRGEADRSTADGRTNLSAPVGSDLRTDTGRPDRTGVPGPSIVHNRATHPSPPDHRQEDTPFTNEHPSDPPRRAPKQPPRQPPARRNPLRRGHCRTGIRTVRGPNEGRSPSRFSARH
ncbi:toxin glutamine deamidase domain-containing protein [Nocardia brasiliensis]|uniref:toxin glutamine deamidase domain-containing protein n=1 Tax=Nocardia brasiliensis TaxID=37326 RepID=UPI0024538DE6|nr:toxin glutamine deamidase domain-containing protein [Nocardia brasiliensis]